MPYKILTTIEFGPVSDTVFRILTNNQIGSRPRLIGIGGYATSGKDELALCAAKLGWYNTYMAKPLEQALLTLNPLITVCTSDFILDLTTYQELHAEIGYVESKENPEVRRLLQVLGVEIGRKLFSEKIWINLAFQDVDVQLETRSVAITGIRFPNELEAIRERGGTVVWMSRPGVGPISSHDSDNSLGPDDFDKIIENDGTLLDLQEKGAKLFA